MARVADHLSVEDLEARLWSAQDPTATRHFQVIWLFIIIPDTAKEKPQEGEVIAVGPGARDENGKLQPLDRQGR